MAKILVVLESPNKEQKIQEYLGDKYIVTSSKGHIRDLDPKSLSIDIENDFKPLYYINKDKEYIASQLKKKYKNCVDVYLATDYDREGEGIAWHVAEILNIPNENRKRMLFTEITKKAIKASTEDIKPLDINLFYAQQARRIIDRLIGYKWLSPLLWRNVQNTMKKGQSLSGGRVQSVVNKLIIDRENEINKFKSENYFKTSGIFVPLNNQTNQTIKMDLDFKFTNDKEVESFIDLIADSEFIIKNINNKKTTRNPSAPFITSTLQQEASNKYKMTPKKTMEYAQRLYENGLITYMRTDSVTLSEEVLTIIKKKITSDYGKEYVNIKQYKNKSKNSQEAHEAIRPSDINIFTIKRDDSLRLCDNCVKLYNLIWRRTLASQMSAAQVNIQTIKLGIINNDLPTLVSKYLFVSKNETILFEGFLKVYKPTVDDKGDNSDDEVKQLTNVSLELNQKLEMKSLNSFEKYTRPPIGRFTEASLVKKLDEMGIGRPSTYSSMISIVQDRNYAEKRDIEGEVKQLKKYKFVMSTCELSEDYDETKINGEKGKLVPTDIGKIVNTYLENNISAILDYKFTIDLEKKLDSIAEGTEKWTNIIKGIYEIFEPKFNTLIKNNSLEKDKHKRLLGIDPYTNREILAYIGKFGPVLCMKSLDYQSKSKNTNSRRKIKVGESSSFDEDRFISLKDKKINLEDITLDKAIEFFKYPYELCKYKDKPVVIYSGKFGLYFKYDNKNWSLKDTEEPQTQEDIEAYFFKKSEQIGSNNETGSNVYPRIINEKISIRYGKWGYYILYKKTSKSKAIFVNIGKQDPDPKHITEEECMILINKKELTNGYKSYSKKK